MHDEFAYGNWGIAITVVLIFTFFVVRYVPMDTRMAKRSGGALIGFFVALFAEMYGFPLTIYLIGHFLDIRIPLDHISGHLLGDFITWLGLGNGWFIVMLVSNLLIITGIWIVSAGWERIYRSGRELVTDGIYSYVRHPQYSGIFLITLGLLTRFNFV